jgi:hypothetical protein
LSYKTDFFPHHLTQHRFQKNRIFFQSLATIDTAKGYNEAHNEKIEKCSYLMF